MRDHRQLFALGDTVKIVRRAHHRRAGDRAVIGTIGTVTRIMPAAMMHAAADAPHDRVELEVTSRTLGTFRDWFDATELMRLA